MNIADFIKIDYFIKKKINKAFIENNRSHSFLSFSEMQSIVILFDIDEWFIIEEIIQDLQSLGKKVAAWTIKPKEYNSKSIIFPEEVKFIDETNDLSWMQVLNEESVQRFRNQRYDTLLDLSTNNNLYIKYLLMINRSLFCIGIKESEKNIYDFIMLKEEDKDILETYQQIKFYLDSMFKTSNNL